MSERERYVISVRDGKGNAWDVYVEMDKHNLFFNVEHDRRRILFVYKDGDLNIYMNGYEAGDFRLLKELGMKERYVLTKEMLKILTDWLDRLKKEEVWAR